MLAAPNHPAHDAHQAQRAAARSAVATRIAVGRPSARWPSSNCSAWNRELRATAEVDRLTAELQRERDRQRNTVPSAAVAKRLQTEMDENARLRKALEEARAKLDAIANIERSISDRPPATEGRTQ